MNTDHTSPASMGGPLPEAERIAEIRRTLKMAKMASANAPGTFWHTFTENTEFLLSRVGVLEGQLATTRGLVADLVDGGKCTFDHHGYCQEHGWFETEPACPHGRAKALGLDGGGSDAE